MKLSKNALVYITLFGMEACWLYAVLCAANHSVGGVLNVALLLSVAFISLGISALSKLLRWPKSVLTALGWAFWPVFMLLMVKIQLFPGLSFADSAWLGSIPHAFSRIFYEFEAPLLIFLATPVLWWLGRRMSGFRPDFSTAITETQLGVVILVIVFFSIYQLKLEMPGSTGLALIFFFFALLGIAVSHARGESWFFSSQKSHWLGITLVLIGLILALGLVVSLIFTPDLIQLIIDAATWVWSMIERLMTFFASLFPASSYEPPEGADMPAMPSTEMENNGGLQVPEWLKPSLTLVWEIMVLGLVVFTIWRISTQIFQWLRRRAPGGAEEVESLKGSFWKDLLGFLRGLIYRLLRIRPKTREDNGIKNLPPQAVTVRQLYAQLLRWTAAGGFPRENHQTPEEYRDMLYRLIPEKEEYLDFITREYINVRYGSGIPAEDTLIRLKESWHELKKSGIKKKGKQPNTH
ncbi:MAG: DUF4129 domain-containing protein [Dehalococcoidales bacterium]|nr:DUF4129 domain-containing protein [Dehalococcoidales bacterium]